MIERSRPPQGAMQTAAVARIAVWAIAALVLDLSSKVLAATFYQRRLLHGLIVQSHNPDFSMGVASASLPVMVLLSCAVLIGFGGWCVHLTLRGRLGARVPGLLIGGATANLLDRIAFGAVHDWLRVSQVDINVADLIIASGVVGFALAAPRILGSHDT